MSLGNGDDGTLRDPEKRQRLIDLFNDGCTYERIGDELGVSGSRVHQILEKLWENNLLTGYPKKR